MPTLAAFIETRIVKIHYADSTEALVNALCDVIGRISTDADVLRMVDIAREQAPRIRVRSDDFCPLGGCCAKRVGEAA